MNRAYTLEEIDKLRYLIRRKVVYGVYIPLDDFGDWDDTSFDDREISREVEDRLRTLLASGVSARSVYKSAVREKLERIAERDKRKAAMLEASKSEKENASKKTEFFELHCGHDREETFFPLYIIEEDTSNTFKVRKRIDKRSWFGLEKASGYITVGRYLASYEDAKRWTAMFDCR